MRSRASRAVTLGAILGLVVLLLSGNVVPVRANVTGVTLHSAGPVGEDNDYFTTVWGNPRDMDDPHDMYVLHSSCGSTTMWSNPQYINGVWRGTTSTGTNRYLWVVNPGWFSALDTQEDGQLRKVDTSRYTQFTFRMRIQSGATVGQNWLLWTDGPIGTVQRSAHPMYLQGDGEWHIYTFDLSSIAQWGSGPVSSIWLQLNSMSAGYWVEVDWIRLTPMPTRQISWTGGSGSVDIILGSDLGDPEERSKLDVYESGGYKDIQASESQPFTIPASLPGGTYYARVADSGAGANSSGAWEIRSVPIADIIAPSYTSGEDFATTVAGNPWDMEGTDDVNVSWTDGDPAQSGLTYSVSGGVLDMTNHDDGGAACSGPWPHRPLALNQGGQNIDTSKYRYVSYRYKVDNAPDQGDGGVMRVRWLSTSKWWAGRTDDISLYNNGWNVYKLDLSSVALEAEMSGWTSTSWNVFQLMINESHRAWTGHLDWVKLTAANEAQGTYTVGWNLLNVPDVLTATVYWDADRDWTNGLASAGQVYVPPTTTLPPLPAGPEFAYLPIVARRYNPEAVDVDAQFSLVLGTSGLSVGSDYWVAIKLEDSYNTVWWYSELPVTIKS